MLGLGQLLFLGLHLRVNGFLVASALLVELTNLVLVGRFGPAVRKPRPVFPAVGPTTHEASVLEFDPQHGLIRVHHDLGGLLGPLVAQTVETPTHLNLAEVETAVDQRRGINDRDVPSLGFEEVQHAVAGLDGAAEIDLAHFVSPVVIVDAIEEIGILPGTPGDLLSLPGGRRAFRRRNWIVLFHLGSEGSRRIHDRTLGTRLGRVTG